MTEPVDCGPEQLHPEPIRLPMRLYMLIGGVSSNEALNCGTVNADPAGTDIAEALKSTMNRWKADGLNLETGKVDYQRLAQSRVIDEFLPLAAALREFDPAALTTDDECKAFWINVYNVLLIHGVVAYKARTSLWNIRAAFERIAYIIGGFRYSLDDIEHGILRDNKAHFLIGGSRFSRSDPRRQYALRAVDPRIHFALVCGASSCPPIGIYQPDKLDRQLDLAAGNFINDGGVLVDRNLLSVSLSRIFKWYSPDFGGKWMGRGKRSPVVRYITPFVTDEAERVFLMNHVDELRVTYQKYDWSLNV